jgi:hypothetical protein
MSKSPVIPITSFWQVATDPDNIWNTNIGNVGIGTADPNNPLHVIGNIRQDQDAGNATINQASGPTQTVDGEAISRIQAQGTDEIGSYRTLTRIRAYAVGDVTENNRGGDLVFSTADGLTSVPERMRIASNGYVFIGKAATDVAVPGWEFRRPDMRCTISGYSPGTEFFPFIFYNQGGVSSAGNITVNGAGTTVSYNSGSDYRLKENAVPLTGALDRVAMFKPLRFNFIGALQEVDGFFAHEAAEVVPEAVTGEKDGEEMQSIDQGKLVPLLVAAIQELTTRLEALEA